MLGDNRTVHAIGMSQQCDDGKIPPSNTPKNRKFPGVKIIHHVLIYEVPLHMITDICHTTP